MFVLSMIFLETGSFIETGSMLVAGKPTTHLALPTKMVELTETSFLVLVFPVYLILGPYLVSLQ